MCNVKKMMVVDMKRTTRRPVMDTGFRQQKSTSIAFEIMKIQIRFPKRTRDMKKTRASSAQHRT